MKLKNVVFTLLLLASASVLAESQGYIHKDADGLLELVLDNICLLDKDNGNAFMYPLETASAVDQIQFIKQDLAHKAQDLSNYDRVLKCEEVTYGLQPELYLITVEGRALESYSTDELKDLIGAADIVVPVDITYLYNIDIDALD